MSEDGAVGEGPDSGDREVILSASVSPPASALMVVLLQPHLLLTVVLCHNMVLRLIPVLMSFRVARYCPNITVYYEGVLVPVPMGARVTSHHPMFPCIKH